MILPWHKADNAAILADMAKPYPDGYRVPLWIAKAEARAVVFMGVRKSWPLRVLADRWGWGKTHVGDLLKEAEVDFEEASGQKRTSTGQTAEESGQATASNRDAEQRQRTKADTDRTHSGHLARARSIPREDQDLEETPPPSPPAAGARQEGQGPQREPPHRPNFGDKPQPPPTQLQDRDAFIERWNAYAEEFYPGQPSQRWEATTINGKRHRNPGMFASPKDAMKEQAMLEHGDHLLPMLDRYAECCRGDHGPEALRAFERGDFEGAKMLAALRLWVTTGKAPFWAGERWKAESPAQQTCEDGGLDNSFLTAGRP